MRLIDATTLKAEFTGNFQDSYPTALIKAIIDDAPTIHFNAQDDVFKMLKCEAAKVENSSFYTTDYATAFAAGIRHAANMIKLGAAE